MGNRIHPQFYVNIADTIAQKRELLSWHQSQRDWLRAHHGVDQYLNQMTGWAARFGAECGLEFAEGFRQHLGHGYPHEPVWQQALHKFIKTSPTKSKVGKCASIVDCLQPYYFHIHLVGSEGSLLDNKIYSAKLAGLNKAKWSTLETGLIDSGDVADHPYQPQFQAFVDAVNNNRKMPLTDFDTAFESHRVVFAADMSAAEGRTVKMSELKF